MSMCSVPFLKDKTIPSEWNENDKERLRNEITFNYAIFLKNFLKCANVQYDYKNDIFRVIEENNQLLNLTNNDLKIIFSVFKEVYCLNGSIGDAPWKNAKPRNKEDEEFLAIMRKAKTNIDVKKNGKQTIDSIIMGVTTKHPSYNLINVWDLTIWQLMTTHSKMYKNDSSYYTQIGIYTGNIDTKKNKIEPNELSWSSRDY